jgi:hypothetical protein
VNTSNVVVLDLRESPEVLPAGLAGGVVVLDAADSLIEHADTYLALVGEGMVTSVICVAIGESIVDESGDGDGAVLAVPPALRYATVLWIGDQRGVDWAPRSSTPRPAEDRADALDLLVGALRVPDVFDRVVTVAEQLSVVAANPGIRAVSGAAQPEELATARAAAVRSLGSNDHPTSQKLTETVRGLDAAHDPAGAALTGPVAAAGADAVKRLHHVNDLARTLGTWRALIGSHRPTEQLGSQVAWAGQAAEKYRAYIAELLNRMDGQLQTGHPAVESVIQLGAQDPRAARGTEIAAGLRQVVDERMDTGAPLPVVVSELRFAAAATNPQGCAAALDDVRGRGKLSLAMPAFARWPVSSRTLPLIFFSCMSLVVLAGGGWYGRLWGGLLAAAWFGSGWLLLGRRPGPQTEHGMREALNQAVPGYGLVALGGVLAGVIVAKVAPELRSVPDLISQLAIVAAFLIAAATVVLSWSLAVRRWRDRLRAPELLGTVIELTRLTEEVIAREWHPMRRRRAIAVAAEEVAAGLEEIGEALRDAGNRLFIATPAEPGNGEQPVPRPAPPELYHVVRADLVDVCRGALAPVWPAAEVASRTSPGVYARRLEGLLGEYGAHVRAHGLMTPPELVRDLAPRDALMARIWSETPSAFAALRTGADGDMTQLCRSGQLGYLSAGAPPGLIRFAPTRLRWVLERDSAHQRLAADPEIAWSEDGELVGALRLLPLRPESVRHVVRGVR